MSHIHHKHVVLRRIHKVKDCLCRVPVIRDNDDILHSFAPFSELVLAAANSAFILHTISAMQVRVCGSMTDYTFTPCV